MKDYSRIRNLLYYSLLLRGRCLGRPVLRVAAKDSMSHVGTYSSDACTCDWLRNFESGEPAILRQTTN